SPLASQRLPPPALREGDELVGEQEKHGRQVEGTQTIVSGAAGRYASALFELARDAQQLDAVKDGLGKFEELVAENAELDRLVHSPVFGADEKLKGLSAILDKAGIGG